MPTIKATLTLTAAAGQISTNALSLTETDTLTVDSQPQQGITRVAIAAGGGTDVTLVPSSSKNKFVYVKHTGFQADGSSSSDNEIVIDFGTTDSIRISANEWAWFPAKASTTVTAVSNHTSTILVEYAYFTRS